MLNCRHMTRLISDGLDRPLSWAERLCLGVHLLGCPPCLRFSRAIRWLHRRLPAAPADVQLPPETRDRIARALEQAGRGE
jgi:hypothetical protein